jgi:outer membrane protein assembly factor BamB/tetratricopeptide (TPR) repeat protein
MTRFLLLRTGWKRIFVVLLAIAANSATFAQQSTADFNNIFPLAPRELRQRLTRAQAAVDEQRYSDAVAEIGEVLNSTGSDDFFLGVPGSADAQVSLKTEALALLGAMPAKGRKMYELQYGSDAKAALESALAAGDLTQLTEVSRRYFQTKAGYEATLILGRCQLDQGRPLAAALTLKRVADVPTALAQYDPELSVMLAACWLHANQPEQAKQTLVSLKSRLPNAKVRLVEREASIFDRDSAALDWLQGIVGSSRSSLSTAATQWVMYRGNEKRNAQSSSGVPLLNYNWMLPTLNNPTDMARVAQQYRAIRDRDEPLVCALQPIVVQNYAVIRQPESNKLIGINLTKEGKREWIYPAFDDSPNAQTVRESQFQNRNPAQTNTRDGELKQRIWEDNIFGQVSSDGRQVYVIDELGIAQVNGVNVPAVAIGPRGMRFQNPAVTRPNNLLVALDLAKQGSLVWTAGGNLGEIPALAGAFFLGAPLPVGDQIYALAEFNGEIRLVCLDSRTGNLEWKQPLATIENFSITNDPSRRLAGASPSLADGILICPTSAGAVVAVDLTTRTLRWGYQFTRNDLSQYGGRGAGFRQPFQSVQTVTAMAKWLDSTATIADGSVVLTPPESQQLHCLDLLSGKARWSPIPRDEMLFVACIHKGKIVLVGRNRLKAINLADGKPAWKNDLKLDSEVSVGRGYYNDSFYYLPTSGQQICKIDLDSGSIVSRAQTEVELGNLVCYQDQLISLSPQSVASFVLYSERLEKQLEQRLAAHPEDIDALSIKAQILLQADKADESLSLLRRAAELAPDRTTVRALLVKVMMVLMRKDFAAHVGLTDELDKLVTDPAQRREVLRWRVQGLTEQKRLDDAFTALLELADQELAAASAGTSSQSLQQIDRERSVRLDRWLLGQLRTILDKADSETKAKVAGELKTRLDRASTTGGVHALRMFLNLFGFHEAADSARLVLIERLIAADALLEAEMVAGDLLDNSNRASTGPARAYLAAIYEKAKRPELAAVVYQQLGHDFANVAARGSKTGGELAREAAQKPELVAYFANWPKGEVEIKESDSAPMNQRNSYPVQVTHYYGAAPRGLKVIYDPGRNDLSIRSETGQVLGNAPLGNSLRRTNTSFGPGPLLTAKLNGHLAVLNLGGDVMAIDGLRSDRGNESLLWRQEAGEEANTGMISSRPSISNRNPLVGPQNMTIDSGGRQNFSTGPINSNGVCFQRGRQIVCVDSLTGQTLWERASSPQAEIPQHAQLFGDEELLFVADAKIDSKAEEALVLSAVDGQLLGRRKIDLADRRWATHGRRVLAVDAKNDSRSPSVTVRLYDAWDSQKQLWSKQVSSGSRGFLVDGEELALLEASGNFTVVSLATGQMRFAVPLEAEPELTWIQIVRSRGQYLLLASQDRGQITAGGFMPLQIAQGLQQRGMHGRMYAFDGATGKLQWQTPAFVSHHYLPPEQPSESPLFFFVANRQSNNKRTTNLLVLDRRTGRNVYEKELNGQAMSCDIAADLTKQTTTLALFGDTNRSLTFQATDKPLAPEPPAQTGDVATRASNRPGIVTEINLADAIEAFRNTPRVLEGNPVAPPVAPAPAAAPQP